MTHPAAPSHPVRRAILALTLALAATAPAPAAEVTFSRIGSGDPGLQQFWGLSPEEAQRYRNIMAATGERYKTASPLAVLAIMADTPEDRTYYAKRAALYEHEMVKREIETALRISEEMSGNVLMEKMTRFTDSLTGINTTDYIPDERKPEWRDGDWLVLYLDDSCLSAGCLNQFTPQMTGTVPPDIKVERVLVLNSKQPLTGVAETIVKGWPQPETVIQRFDPIEHHYLQRGGEKGSVALHVRDRQVVEVLTGKPGTAAATTATAAPAVPQTAPAAPQSAVAPVSKAPATPATVPAVATPATGTTTATPAASGTTPSASNKTPTPVTGKTTGGKS